VTGTSITGRAISFLEGAGEWNVKGKVFLIMGFLIIVLLIFYFVTKKRE
jgi:lipoprotein signal peptidase